MAMTATTAATFHTVIDQSLAPPTATIAAAAAAPAGFCSLWPQAKPILQLLSGIAILNPWRRRCRWSDSRFPYRGRRLHIQSNLPRSLIFA